DIIAICSFVLDPDDLKIFEAPALTPEQRAIEAAERKRVEDAQGYGFFGPDDDVAPVRGELSEDDLGYGFFQPIEQIRAAAGIVATAPEPVVAAISVQAQNMVEHLAELSAEKKAAKKDDKNESSSIRVSVEKVDQLIN